MIVLPDHKAFFFLLLLPAFVVSPSDTLSGQNPATQLNPDKVAFFETHIRPLLIKNCYECHSRTSGESEGGLLMDSAAALLKGGNRGAVLNPGKPQQSLLMKVVNYRERNLQMPPDGKLSDRDIELLRQWIESGAIDPRLEKPDGSEHSVDSDDNSHLDRDPSTHWAFNLPVLHAAAALPHADIEDPIDVFAASAAKQAGITTSPRADRKTLARRLYFD